MPIQTTLIGSYPAPHWLRGDPSRAALRDATMAVLKTQELAGIDVVSDGEINRFDSGDPDSNGMIDYFVGRLDGIRTRFSLADIAEFRTYAPLIYRDRPAGIVTGPIGEGTLNLPGDFELVRSLTTAPVKFTCTGPHMLAKVLTDQHYGAPEKLAMEIAGILRRQLAMIGADLIQLDEPNISGHPEEAEWAAEAINHVLDGLAAARAVHICYGNHGGQTVQRGTWRSLMPFLNELHTEHLFLEFARRGYDELVIFKGMNPETSLGLSVIDVKDMQIEPADVIARRIDHAVTLLGDERIGFVHPDCGLWMLPRSVADGKIRALVEGRDRFEGRD